MDGAAPGTPKVYSGTRMDILAARGDWERLRAFPGEPPARPLLDLPFSLLLDTLVLPVTLPTAAYEVFIEPVEGLPLREARPPPPPA